MGVVAKVAERWQTTYVASITGDNASARLSRQDAQTQLAAIQNAVAAQTNPAGTICQASTLDQIASFLFCLNLMHTLQGTGTVTYWVGRAELEAQASADNGRFIGQEALRASMTANQLLGFVQSSYATCLERAIKPLLPTTTTKPGA